MATVCDENKNLDEVQREWRERERESERERENSNHTQICISGEIFTGCSQMRE